MPIYGPMPNVQAFGQLTGAADKLGYFTGPGALALADFTSFARNLLDDANAATMLSTLGAGTAATATIGTSGATVPLLNGTNTHSGISAFSAALSVTGTSNTFTVQGSAIFGGTASAASYATINNGGFVLIRQDTAGYQNPLRFTNYGITASGHGSILDWYWGTGGAFGAVAMSQRLTATEDWSAAGTRSAKWSLQLINDGSTFEAMCLQPTGEFQLQTVTIIDANRLLNIRSYTVGTLPTPGTAGRKAYASNGRAYNGAGTLEGAAAGTGVEVTDNGTAWKITGTNQTVQA